MSTPGPVVIFIYGESIALRRSSHGEAGIKRIDHIVDDDDQHVLAIARLGNAQLAGLSNFMLHVVNDSG